MAKMQKKKDVEMLWKERAAESEQQCKARGPGTLFIGFLSLKNKPDLQEITAALDLPEDDTVGSAAGPKGQYVKGLLISFSK